MSAASSALQAGGLQPQAQPRERCAQLMGGVGDEVALGGERAPEPVGHVVEGVRDLAVLGARPSAWRARRGRRPRRRAVRVRPRSGRDREPASPREDQPERERGDAEAEERERVAADLVVDRVDGLRDPHRAGRATRVDDRHGGEEQVLVERVAVARALRGGPAQRLADLGPARVGRAARGGAGGVDEHAAARVDDDHAAAQAAGAVAHEGGSAGRRSSRPAALAATSLGLAPPPP